MTPIFGKKLKGNCMVVKLVIPARLKSTRLPNKPLISICGKTMLQRTYERGCIAVGADNVHIATDDNAIVKVAKEFTDQVHLTSTACMTGTDRVAQFADIIEADCYVNLQGDEPIMPIENIKTIFNAGKRYPGLIINGYAKITERDEYMSPMIPKVVFKEDKTLMYMSRAPIPGNKQSNLQSAYKQICVYSFPADAMAFQRKNSLKSFFENLEDIEILRFIEKGWTIKMIELSPNTIAIDVPDDLVRVRAVIETQGENLEKYSI